MSFKGSFALDGFDGLLPAGAYRVQWQEDVLDDMFLPDYLRTSALLHLHSSVSCPGHAQTLTVPWQELELALLRDRMPSVRPIDPGLDEMLREPIVRLLMRSDDLSESEARKPIARTPTRGQ